MKLSKDDCLRAFGAFTLRLGLGLLFLISGLGKVTDGGAGFRGYIAKQFSETWLPDILLIPFGYVLPFAEAGLGALLILGVCRCCVLPLGALLMVSLTFGQIVLGEHQTVSNNMIYVALFAATMFVSKWDRLALDNVCCLCKLADKGQCGIDTTPKGEGG